MTSAIRRGLPARLVTFRLTAPGVRVLLSLIAGAAVIATQPTPANAQWQWTDVTTPALAETVSIHDKKGVAFVDFDGDGDPDLSLVGEGPHAGILLRNDGGGVWTDVTPAPLLAPGSGSAQSWADYDNDGDVDEFVSTEEEPMRLLRNDGGGVFTNVTSGVLLEEAHGHSTAWVDYDVDGRLDLYVAFFKQASRLLRNTGSALVDATQDSLGVAFGDGVAWGDYDDDGDPDVYLARFTQWPSVYMRNDGPAGFVNATTPVLGVRGNGHSASTADYDNDGDLDLLYVNVNGPNHLFCWNGGAFYDCTPPNLVLDTHSVSGNWADFDNDGWLDLFMTQSQEYQNHFFHNNGDGTFTDIVQAPLLGTGANAGVAVADYDGDGDLDLYLSSYSRRPNQLLRNDLANGNHWIGLDLRGTVSNRSAIGARVWLTSGGRTQMQELAAATGFRSENSLTMHFGLGASTTVSRVLIRWPSGILQDTSLAVVDHRVPIVERFTGLGVAGRPGGPALASPAPNPAVEGATFSYSLPARGAVRLSIVDAQGRTLRVVEAGDREAGTHTVAWNGRDATGARVPPGVFWGVLDAEGVRVSRRIAVVR
jgi:hypothetical protein